MMSSKLKAKILTVSLLVLTTVGLSAQNTGNVQNNIRKTFASEQITVANTAIGFTAATINPTCTECAGNARATLASCYLGTAQIRILTSGTTPTSTLGIVVDIGQKFEVYGYDDILAFRAIRTGSTSGVLDCQYSRLP